MGTTTKIVFGSIFAISITVMFLVFSLQKSAQQTLDLQAKEETIAAVQKQLEAIKATAQDVAAENAQIPDLQNNLSSIQNEVTSYKKQITDLESIVQQQQAEAQTQSVEFAALQKSYKDQQQRLEEIARAKTSAEKLSSQTSEEVQVMQAQLEKLDSEISNSQTSVEQKSQAIAFYKEKLQVALDEMAAMKTANTATQMNLELILDELAGKTRTVTALSARLEELTGTAVIPGEASALIQGDDLPVTEVEALQKLAASLQSKINEQSAVIDNLQENLKVTSDELAIASQDNKELTAPLTERISLLELQLEDAVNVNTKLEEELLAAKKTNADFETLTKVLNTDITSVRAANEETKKLVTQLQEKLETAETALQQKQEELLGLTEEVAAVHVGLTATEAQSSALTDELEALKTTLANERNARDEQIKTLQDQLASQSEAAENSATLKQELEQLRSAVAEKEAAIAQLTDQLNANSAELASLKDTLSQAQAQVGSDTKDNQEQEARIARLIEEVAAAKAVAATQTEKLLQVEKQFAASSKENVDSAGLEEKITHLEAALEENKQEITSLQAAITVLTVERDKLLLQNSDSDNDGVSDADDTCQDTVANAEVDAKGCEKDSDLDGFVNRLDLCPDTASGAAVDKAGCAEDQTTVVLKGITFQLGTAKLTPAAKQTLNNAAAILQNNPDISMEVAGHTDSVGQKERNLQLSSQRAEAVMQYLVSQGVPAESLRAKGYGAEYPIADNRTKKGRAQNRRVELRRIEAEAPQQEEKEVVEPVTEPVEKQEAVVPALGD